MARLVHSYYETIDEPIAKLIQEDLRRQREEQVQAMMAERMKDLPPAGAGGGGGADTRA